MPFGHVPVNHPAAVVGVYLAVHGAAHGAAKRDAGCPDAPENGVKRVFADAEAVVLKGKRLVGLDEIKRQPVVDVDGEERTDGRGAAGHAEQFGELPRRGVALMRRNDGVIKFDGHDGLRILRVNPARSRGRDVCAHDAARSGWPQRR